MEIPALFWRLRSLSTLLSFDRDGYPLALATLTVVPWLYLVPNTNLSHNQETIRKTETIP